MTLVQHSSKSNEWYSPPDIVEVARALMGGIDLDPASAPLAQQVIRANEYFSGRYPGDDGLAPENRPWRGRVWLNPPYGGQTFSWIRALLADYSAGHVTEATGIVRGAVETKYFQALIDAGAIFCVPNKRLAFWREDPGEKTQPGHASAIFYLGPSHAWADFVLAFSGVGPSLARWRSILQLVFEAAEEALAEAGTTEAKLTRALARATIERLFG